MKNQLLSLRSGDRGISLIEGVLYLVIALAVIVGGIVFFQQAQLSNNVTATARAAVGISSQTRALYHDQQSFGDNAPLTAAVVKAGAVPSTFVAGDPAAPTIEHPFDGPVTITGQGRGFVVTFAGISKAACIRLGSVDPTGQGPLGTGITGLTISSDGAVDPAASPEMTGGITAETISSACADEAEMAVYYAGNPGDASGGGGSGPDINEEYVGQSMYDSCGGRPARSDLLVIYRDCQREWGTANYDNIADDSLRDVCGDDPSYDGTAAEEYEYDQCFDAWHQFH